MDHLWQSGFCPKLIERLRYVPDGPAGSDARIELTQHHLQEGCPDCCYATAMKSIEAEVAERMGTEAINVFQRNGNIRRLPGFQRVFDAVMAGVLSARKIGPDIMRWMTDVIGTRFNKPYPAKKAAQQHQRHAN